MSSLSLTLSRTSLIRPVVEKKDVLGGGRMVVTYCPHCTYFYNFPQVKL